MRAICPNCGAIEVGVTEERVNYACGSSGSKAGTEFERLCPVLALNEFHVRNLERQHEAFAPAHSLMALVVCAQEELGELAGAVLGVTGEKKRKAHKLREDVLDGVADAITYLSLIASKMGELDLDGLLRRTFNMVSRRAGSKIFVTEVSRRTEDEVRQGGSRGHHDAEAFRTFASDSSSTPEARERPKPVASAASASGNCHCGAARDARLDPGVKTLAGYSILACEANGDPALFELPRCCRACGVVYCKPRRVE